MGQFGAPTLAPNGGGNALMGLGEGAQAFGPGLASACSALAEGHRFPGNPAPIASSYPRGCQPSAEEGWQEPEGLGDRG